MSRKRTFAGAEYLDAYRKHYPELYKKKLYAVDVFDHWQLHEDELGADDTPDRFVPLEKRSWVMLQHAWNISSTSDLRWIGACKAYKGLVNLKPPFDLVLYSSLIWEVQPKTIIEFGALQGGSSLWLADHLEMLCGAGEVHSFELFDKCIHPRAKHPRLHFHKADLRDVKNLDTAFFEQLPHPWLIIDDAHTNLENLGPYFGKMMAVGDYYIWEDVFLRKWATSEKIAIAVKIAKESNLMVDRKYTDAFGYNVTCSPNGWFRKSKTE